MVIPLIWTIYLSFFKGGILKGTEFVGLRNYLTIFENKVFLVSLKNTFIYVIIIIPTVIIISLFIAVFISDKYIRGKNIFKTLIFFPNLAPMVTLSIMWNFIIHPEFGLFNLLLKWIGVVPPNWLGDGKYAFLTILLLELWRGIGFYVVTYISALVSVPDELYEAGLLDGATGLKKFFYLTLPSIRPTLLFTLIMATIWNFQVFDSVFVLTRGGPANATSTVVWYIYASAFQFERIGRASTMAVVLMVIIFVLSIIQFKYLRTDNE
jgi:ABC-type sugar transport system permease subunit